jgi:hypothetical protein
MSDQRGFAAEKSRNPAEGGLNESLENLELRAAVAQLRADLDSAKAESLTLLNANNIFRTLMLSQTAPIPLIDAIQIARTKNNWAKADVTVLMQFFEIFSEHTKLFAELIAQKKSSDALKQHVKDKYAALHARAEDRAEGTRAAQPREFSKTSKKEKVQKIEAIVENLSPEAVKEAKALKGLMKSLGVDLATARTMLGGMKLNGAK